MKTLLQMVWLVSLFLPGFAKAATSIEILTLPVQVHLVRSTVHPWLNSTITEAEVQAAFAEVNRIWESAGIRFEVRGIRVMQALNIAPKRFFERSRNWVRQALPQADLQPGVIDLCFIHDMGPNGFYYGEPAVVSEKVASNSIRGGSQHPVGRVAAHELGHALTLQHRSERDFLMAPAQRGTRLDAEETAAARARAQQMLLQGVP